MGRRSVNVNVNVNVKWCVAVLALSLLGCASALSDAKAAYKAGRYAEAKSLLIAAESAQQTRDAKAAAEYALYRGLAHHALGDRAEALGWLRRAKAVDDATPGTLSLDDRARLDLALESTSPDVAPAPP